MKRDWIDQLERQGCWSEDWGKVELSEATDLRKIRNVYFQGEVRVGKNPELINIPGGLKDVRIGDNVRIVNAARIAKRSGATFGVGVDVAVLDETGSRKVKIYPGLNAQTATLAALMPDFGKGKLRKMTEEYIETLPDMPEIGDNAEILNSGDIIDTRVWPGVRIEGALRLKNGSVISNIKEGKPLAHVGHGVDAENFLIEDGEVNGGSIIRNCHVGQGAIIDKGFTAHDSLFFANCTMENGEACAVLAGPYTVSMHKSSLLIGCQTSFMNAGSGTNMSNHLYKLGPVHCGVLERGVKMASNAYIMHGSRIGAYSMVMGEHKKHPDTSKFPFSYLFGDGKGATILIPGAMLKSYGLKRDGEKWPKRDRRETAGITGNDEITYPILNPMTASGMIEAIRLSKELIETTAGDIAEYDSIKISKKHLEEGIRLYETALSKYAGSTPLPENETESGGEERWLDLGGQLLRESTLRDILKAETLTEIIKMLKMEAAEYEKHEGEWKAANLRGYQDERGKELDRMIESDRIAAEEGLRKEAGMMEMFGLAPSHNAK